MKTTIDDEVDARVDFKMKTIWGVLKESIARNGAIAFDQIFKGNHVEGQKAQHYKEAFEQFKQIFEKETKMISPYDEMAHRKFVEARDVAVDKLMNELHPTERRRINTFVSIIENAMKWRP